MGGLDTGERALYLYSPQLTNHVVLFSCFRSASLYQNVGSTVLDSSIYEGI